MFHSPVGMVAGPTIADSGGEPIASPVQTTHGSFVSSVYEADCARFLAELRERLVLQQEQLDDR